MTLTLDFHPLSSFCHKALIDLYMLDVPFERLVRCSTPSWSSRSARRTPRSLPTSTA